jgi:hypothetical protein
MSYEKKYNDLLKTNVLSDIYSVPRREKRMVNFTQNYKNSYILTIEDRFQFVFDENTFGKGILSNRAGCGSYGCSVVGIVPNNREALIPGIKKYVIKILANGRLDQNDPSPKINREEQVLEEINIQRLVYQCIPNATPFIYKKLFGEYTRSSNIIKRIAIHSPELFERYSFYISEYYHNTPLYTIFKNYKDEESFLNNIRHLLNNVHGLFRFMSDNKKGDLNDTPVKIIFKHNDFHSGNMLYNTDKNGNISTWKIIDFGVATVSRVYNTEMKNNYYNFDVPSDIENDISFKYKLENYIDFLPSRSLSQSPKITSPPLYNQFPVTVLSNSRHMEEYKKYITDYIFSDYHVFFYTFIKTMIKSFGDKEKPSFYTQVLYSAQNKYDFYNMSIVGDNIVYRRVLFGIETVYEIKKMNGHELLYEQFKWLLKAGYLKSDNLFSPKWQPYLSIWRVVALFVEVYISYFAPELYKRMTSSF